MYGVGKMTCSEIFILTFTRHKCVWVTVLPPLQSQTNGGRGCILFTKVYYMLILVSSETDHQWRMENIFRCLQWTGQNITTIFIFTHSCVILFLVYAWRLVQLTHGMTICVIVGCTIVYLIRCTWCTCYMQHVLNQMYHAYSQI